MHVECQDISINNNDKIDIWNLYWTLSLKLGLQRHPKGKLITLSIQFNFPHSDTKHFFAYTVICNWTHTHMHANTNTLNIPRKAPPVSVHSRFHWKAFLYHNGVYWTLEKHFTFHLHYGVITVIISSGHYYPILANIQFFNWMVGGMGDIFWGCFVWMLR